VQTFVALAEATLVSGRGKAALAVRYRVEQAGHLIDNPCIRSVLLCVTTLRTRPCTATAARNLVARPRLRCATALLRDGRQAIEGEKRERCPSE
jgi:hypothetical protein